MEETSESVGQLKWGRVQNNCELTNSFTVLNHIPAHSSRTAPNLSQSERRTLTLSTVIPFKPGLLVLAKSLPPLRDHQQTHTRTFSSNINRTSYEVKQGQSVRRVFWKQTHTCGREHHHFVTNSKLQQVQRENEEEECTTLLCSMWNMRRPSLLVKTS